MRYPHRATVYRRAAAATTSNRGRPQAAPQVVASGVLCNIQRKDGGVAQTEAGITRQGTWAGFFAPGTELRPEDRIRVTPILPDGGAFPRIFRVADVYPVGGRWDTQTELTISGETLPEEPAPEDAAP